MTNLSRSNNPARQLTWKGKSLALCSRNDLVEAVIAVTGQLSMLQAAWNEKAKADPLFNEDAFFFANLWAEMRKGEGIAESFLTREELMKDVDALALRIIEAGNQGRPAPKASEDVIVIKDSDAKRL